MNIKTIEENIFNLHKTITSTLKKIEEKHICSVCDQEVDDNHWIKEQAMCVGCYNEIIQDQQYKYGERL